MDPVRMATIRANHDRIRHDAGFDPMKRLEADNADVSELLAYADELEAARRGVLADAMTYMDRAEEREARLSLRVADLEHRLAHPCDGNGCDGNGCGGDGPLHCHRCPEAEENRLLRRVKELELHIRQLHRDNAWHEYGVRWQMPGDPSTWVTRCGLDTYGEAVTAARVWTAQNVEIVHCWAARTDWEAVDGPVPDPEDEDG